MGYLDNSTNNIILDAVLTDYGRQRLATANSAFNVSHYALGDDEVDYRLIKKYGRALGKEKIEKNTPIFEALTNQSIALKYPLIGRETDGVSIASSFLPVLTSNIASVDLIKETKSSVALTVTLTFNNGNVPTGFIETKYKIRVSDRFFFLNGGTGGTLDNSSTASLTVSPGDPNRIALYNFTVTNNSTSITFNVNHRTIDNTTLSVYGKRTSTTASSQRKIESYITVTGEKYGSTISIPVSYTASTT